MFFILKAINQFELKAAEVKEEIEEKVKSATQRAPALQETTEEAQKLSAQDESVLQKLIEESKEYAEVGEQVKYLIGKANDFLNNGKFDLAIGTAQHILQSLDPNSIEAKDIIEKAKAALKSAAESAAKGAAEGVMEDVKKKIGEFGGLEQ